MLQQRGFNRVAVGAIGSIGALTLLPEGVNMMVSVEDTAVKYLNSIHISVAPIEATSVSDTYLVRVGVFSQQGKFPLTADASQYSPYGLLDPEKIGDVGRVYYDHVLQLQYNNEIIFDEPIFFNTGEKIFALVSSAYKSGETDATVPARYIRMSLNGKTERAAGREWIAR